MNPLPQSTLYLAFAIPNKSDSATYYPQAVIRNSKTGIVIATVNLTQDPNLVQRYTGNVFLPADSSGNGYYIDIITTPYTDSGHSTPSLNYYSDVQQFFVYQAPANYGGGYMEFPSKKDLRELFEFYSKDIVQKFPEQREVKIPDFPNIPAPEKTDLTEVYSRFSEILSAITALHSEIRNRPRFEKTDHSPVLKEIQNAKHEIALGISDGYQAAANIRESRTDAFLAVVNDKMAGILKTLSSLKEGVQFSFFQNEETPRSKNPMRSLLKRK